ncbi:MAG TPA: GAF domain-containing protein [Ignavibacteriaceae bacterium]|nr:GAF domain-containing protein [Ignavibacteriaceae bacterium]
MLKENELNYIFQTTVSFVKHILNANYVNFFEVNAFSSKLILKASADWDQELVGIKEINNVSNSIEGYNLAINESIVIINFKYDKDFHFNMQFKNEKFKNAICVLIKVKDIPFGLLSVYFKENKLNEDTKDFLLLISKMISTKIEIKLI